MRPAISSPRLRLALLALSVAALFAIGPPEARTALAYIGPFLVLLGFLLADRYPGERLIRHALRRASRRRPATIRMPVLSFEPIVPRGGHLLASALAGRAPPAPAKRPALL